MSLSPLATTSSTLPTWEKKVIFEEKKVQQCPEIFAHHVEGTLGQVVVLASKDFLDKIIIATISWIDFNS